MVHFTLRDLTQSALALPLFLPLFFAPGYLIAWFGNIAGFRRASPVERIAWSIPLSIATGTLLMVWAATLGGLALAVACYALLGLAAAALIVWETRLWQPAARAHLAAALQLDRYAKLAFLVIALWSAALLLQLVDLQWGDSLLASITVRDHAYRVAFIQSVLRSGVPPTNPLYSTGHPAPMRNYYFWYVICAVVCKASTLAARNVLIASCAWASTGLFCTAALFCKYFLAPRTGLRRTAFTALLLFGVTGLDLIMVLYLRFSTHVHRIDPDPEWWNPDDFPSWLDCSLYVPHHIASLACCMTALVLLWVTRDAPARSTRWLAIALAAVAFTTAFGCSIYVAFAFSVTMLIWCVFLWFEHQRRLIRMILVAGIVAGVLLVPFLLQLRGDNSGAKQPFPLKLQVRSLYGLQESADALAHKSRFYAKHIKAVRNLLWFVYVVPVLTLELGLYGLCGVLAVWQWRRGRFAHEPGIRALLALTAGGLFATLSIRSSVIAINDYALRTALIPLFFLLVLTAKFLSEGLVQLKPSRPLFNRPLRTVAFVFLVLGATETLYQALDIRFFLTLFEHHRLRDTEYNAAHPEMGRHTYQLRKAYDALDKIAPASATVQYNSMSIGSYFVWLNMISAGHQIISADPGCDVAFGGDTNQCPMIEKAVNTLYLDPAPTREAALAICRGLGIDYLVATDYDPAWQDEASWVWSQNAVVEEPYVRILPCR